MAEPGGRGPSDEAVGLRAFLRSRCGSLQAAFRALDGHSVGQVTSDDFVKGLERLGFTGNAAAIFRELDTTQSGLISFRLFMEGIGGFPVPEEAVARLAKVEEQVAADQKSMAELEQRLVRRLESLAGAGLAEQLDALRQQIVEEREQRLANTASLRAGLEILRGESRQAASDVEAAMVREVAKALADAEAAAASAAAREAARASADLRAELLGAQAGLIAKAVAEAEARASQLSESSAAAGASAAALAEALAAQLEELRCSVTARLDAAEAATRELCRETKEELASLVAEDRRSGQERAQALSKTLGAELERTILSQAVTEARAAATGELERVRRTEALLPASEAAASPTSSSGPPATCSTAGSADGGGSGGRLAAVVERLEGEIVALTSKGATTDLALSRLRADLSGQADALTEVQHQQRALSDELRGRLGALIAKVDTKCEEGFAGLDGGSSSLDMSGGKFSAYGGGEHSEVPRLLGSPPPRHKKVHPPGTPLRHASPAPMLPESAGPTRSASCGDFWRGAASTDGMGSPDISMASFTESTLQALREENLRLREANVEMRELAVQSHLQDDAKPAARVAAVVAAASPPLASRAAVVQPPLQVRPGQSVGVARLSSAPRMSAGALAAPVICLTAVPSSGTPAPPTAAGSPVAGLAGSWRTVTVTAGCPIGAAYQRQVTPHRPSMPGTT